MQSQQTLIPPTAPGQPYVVAPVTTAPPTTTAELRALRQRRSELSDQITNVSSRRDRVANQLKSADPAARPGLEARLAELDARIVSMERELAVTGEAVRAAPVALLAATQAPEDNIIVNRVAEDLVPIVAILSVFVFGPLAIAFSRFIWRRAAAPPRVAPVTDTATQQRLDQLQQAVDTIAIEVERISEGQRFVTRVLTEGATPALSAGAAPAEPVRVGGKAAAAVKRGP